VLTVLDTWASFGPWPGKDRLELWLLQTLQRGAFLLEQPAKATFRARMDGREELSADESLRMETFYTEATETLLDLLADGSGASVIPPNVLNMCHAIHDKLRSSPKHQRQFPQFVLTRWLFSPFFHDMITLPEAFGLLTDHYLSELARQKILREIVMRAQRAVFDVAYIWKHGNPISSGLRRIVDAIATRFQRPFSQPKEIRPPCHNMPLTNQVETFLTLRASDALMLVNALYPSRTVPSSSRDSLKSGVHSSASSVSGFSLFQGGASGFSTDRCHSPLPDSSSLHVNAPGTPQIDVYPEHLVEDLPMRHVRLELEELVSSKVVPTDNSWLVLAACSATQSLCTMDRLIDGCSYEHTGHNRQGSPGATVTASTVLSENLQSCANSVTLLIHKLEVMTESDAIMNSNVPQLQDVFETRKQIYSLFEQLISDHEYQMDFVEAHIWHERLRAFDTSLNAEAAATGLHAVLTNIKYAAEDSVSRATALEADCEIWTRLLKTQNQLQSKYVKPLIDEAERLRDKMWYSADVRSSAVYDEARGISNALRTMGKPKRTVRTHMAPPLKHWAGPRLSSAVLPLKSDSQILDLLSARPEHGGPNKLSDDQSRATATWLQRQNIENLCKGEERLHKFCMEVQRCTDGVLSNLDVETCLLWSHPSWRRGQNVMQQSPIRRRPTSSLCSSVSQSTFFPRPSYLMETSSSVSRTLSSNHSSRDFVDTRSPALTNQSSVPFWSPATTEVDCHSSATSVVSSLTQSAFDAMPSRSNRPRAVGTAQSLDKLRRRITALLLSDLSPTLFSNGSETDRALWTGLGLELMNKHIFKPDRLDQNGHEQFRNISSQPSARSTTYHFENAFAGLLQKFSVTHNPTTKLSCLSDIDKLLAPYMAERQAAGLPSGPVLRSSSSESGSVEGPAPSAMETSVSGFRCLFLNSQLRPSTIFRDLQYIAALLPATVLQNTAPGRAFCNAAVAIASIKKEVRTLMVETADGIIAYQSNNRGHGRSSSAAQQQRDAAIFPTPSRTSSTEDVAHYSMADAAYLLHITAKEGDHVAQRELATLYLTHPELMDRIVAPLTPPRSVFREELESKWRKNQDPSRCDPTTMCVAHHWMMLSDKGGDALAAEYLRQHEEMD